MAHIRTDLSTARRIYVQTKYGEPAVADIKALGAKWDPDAKCWWVGTAKRAALESLLVGADKAADEAPAAQPAKQDPADIHLTGKGTYKGRTYYLGSRTKDGARIRCLTLPDANGNYLDFWADVTAVEVTKTYEPRQVWDGRRYSNHTVTQYTTLGSIAKFIARQSNPATRRVQCVECGSWFNEGEECRDCGGA